MSSKSQNFTANGTSQKSFHWEHLIGVLGFAGLAVGHFWGLFYTPPDSHMGDVVKILFVHVPSAWNCMLVFTIAFGAALISLIADSERADCLLAGALEVGVLLTALTLVTGSIFAHPTWGIWWTSNPRLNSTAIMFLTFVGIIMLRALVDDTQRRATWSSVATIIAYVNVPITYMAVRWMRSIHQLQSSPADVDGPLKLIWRITALALFAVAIWLIVRRYRIERDRYAADTPLELPEATHV